jgi:uncharacterized protein (TIRG00374 family)
LCLSASALLFRGKIETVSDRKFFYLKLGLTIVLLVILFARVNVVDVVHTIGRFSIATWALNFTLYFGAWWIASLKWKLLLPGYALLNLLRLNFVGQYYSILFPGQIAGEVMKAYRLGKGQADAEQIAASVIIDRITGLAGLLCLAVSGVIFHQHPIDPRFIRLFIGISVLLLVVLFSLNFRWWLRFLLASAKRLGRFGEQATRLLEAWKQYLTRPRLLLVSTALGVCYQMIAVVINLLFARELGIDIGFMDWSWVFGVVSIATMLPLTIGGIGLREGSFIGALSLVGIPSEKAFAVSIAVFSLLLAGAAAGGVIDWTLRRNSSPFRIDNSSRNSLQT